jgi:hypothetical protein
MGSVEVAVAMVIVFAFALGMAIGVVVIVSFASRREDRLNSLWSEAPDPACGGVRRLVSAGVRGGLPVRGLHGRDEDDPGPGQESER